MATSSSMRYSVVQADEELLQQTLGIYTKGAMFWGKQSGTTKTRRKKKEIQGDLS
jgi:hypothetical protein